MAVTGVGVPVAGYWQEILNTDAREFGGAGWGNLGGVQATPVRSHRHTQSLCLTLPPLSTLYLRPQPAAHDHATD